MITSLSSRNGDDSICIGIELDISRLRYFPQDLEPITDDWLAQSLAEYNVAPEINNSIPEQTESPPFHDDKRWVCRHDTSHCHSISPVHGLLYNRIIMLLYRSPWSVVKTNPLLSSARHDSHVANLLLNWINNVALPTRHYEVLTTADWMSGRCRCRWSVTVSLSHHLHSLKLTRMSVTQKWMTVY